MGFWDRRPCANLGLAARPSQGEAWGATPLRPIALRHRLCPIWVASHFEFRACVSNECPINGALPRPLDLRMLPDCRAAAKQHYGPTTAGRGTEASIAVKAAEPSR